MTLIITEILALKEENEVLLDQMTRQMESEDASGEALRSLTSELLKVKAENAALREANMRLLDGDVGGNKEQHFLKLATVTTTSYLTWPQFQPCSS